VQQLEAGVQTHEVESLEVEWYLAELCLVLLQQLEVGAETH
jgi:hypothetical protein